MLVHTGIKEHQCEVCQKKFSRKYNFNQHMLTHTKLKAYECDICKKKFSLKSNLVRHFRIHLGEKPYGCSECGKWYTHPFSRDHHIRTRHKELSKKQQSKLKCKIQKSIVHEYLKTISEYNNRFS